MSFKSVGRLPMIEWAGYWDKALDRWYGQLMHEIKVFCLLNEWPRLMFPG